MNTTRISCHRILSCFATAMVVLLGACDAPGECPDGACTSAIADAELSEAQQRAFSKRLVLSDGANHITLLVAADDEARLDAYDSESFEVFPLFERPAPSLTATEQPLESATEAADEADDEYDPDAVVFEELSAELEDGAIGYGLRFVGPAFRNGIQSCSSPNKYTSSKDFAWITVMVGSSSCTEARISTRKYSWSWYAEKAHAHSLCGGMTLDAGKKKTDRVKLEVCPGPGYTYGFYN